MSSWYIQQNNGQIGPFSFEILKEKALSGELKPKDNVWKSGSADWVTAEDIPELFSSPPPIAIAKPLPEILSTRKSKKSWYVQDSKKNIGPLTFVELQTMAVRGQLNPDDVVWSEGEPRWIRAGDVEALPFPQAPPQQAPPKTSPKPPLPELPLSENDDFEIPDEYLEDEPEVSVPIPEEPKPLDDVPSVETPKEVSNERPGPSTEELLDFSQKPSFNSILRASEQSEESTPWQKIQNDIRKRKLRWILSGSVAFLFLAVIFLFILFNSGNQEETVLPTIHAETVVQATDLTTMYEKDSAVAEEMYHGKRFVVVGYIHEIGDLRDDIRVSIKGHGRHEVICTINNFHRMDRIDVVTQLSGRKKGQIIRISGIAAGPLTGNALSLDKCYLLK